MNTFQFCRYLREATGERTYLPKMTRIFPAKIVRNQDVLYYKNKARGDIFEEKDISEPF